MTNCRLLLCLTALLLLIMGCQNHTIPKTTEADPIVIRYMHMGVESDSEDSNSYVMNQLPMMIAKQFPDITLRPQMLPDAPYTKTLLVQLASGEGPDFFEWWPMRQLEELVAAGYLQDLSGLDILKNFTSDALEGFIIDGKVYGLPKGLSMMGTWYNKTLFNQHGIDFPVDWPSFLAICERLKQAGVTPIVMPDNDRRFIQFGLYQLAASIVYAEHPNFDAELLAGDRTFTDSPWRDVLLKYKLLYDKGYIASGSLSTGVSQAMAIFNEGRAAMVFNGNWDYVMMTDGGSTTPSSGSFERGFLPLPGNEPGNPLLLSVGPAGGTVVNANSRHLDEVLDILEYQFDPSSPLYIQYKQSYDVFPMNKGETLGLPELVAFTNLMQDHQSVYFSNQAWPVGIADELCRGFQDWIAGHGTVDDILNRMDERLAELR